MMLLLTLSFVLLQHFKKRSNEKKNVKIQSNKTIILPKQLKNIYLKTMFVIGLKNTPDMICDSQG